ncbi:MAG TPA: [protein-PII] uridylyltransferase [Candidatus Acidoferrales bacterium]|nr:[protein-PII] uridylyltransferase [Candidatus Acidoferrales bacterium]
MPAISSLPDLAAFCAEETAKIRRAFESSGDGRAALAQRCRLADTLIAQLARHCFSAAPPAKRCMVAIGGYGRRMLFPCSDIDLLFLFESEAAEAESKPAVAELARILWDLHFRVSPTARTLEECAVVQPDNVEFHFSLLDSRFLCGDEELLTRLQAGSLPQALHRSRRHLIETLADLTAQRHAKHGNTIFHLEPNVKEAPGGLRDFDAACWLLRLGGAANPLEQLTPPELRAACDAALDFLAAIRCFLHFHHGRDDNVLTYELQDAAAARGLGHSPAARQDPAGWMRVYFRHARTLNRLVLRLLDESLAPRVSFVERFLQWRSHFAHPGCTVLRGRVDVRNPARLRDPASLLDLFLFLAREGLRLSREAERRITEILRTQADADWQSPSLWPALSDILAAPFPVAVLRAMHQLGLLVRIFPEFRAIDALVVRDFYHRYTVDEHSLRTIENLERLRRPENEWERRFAEILSQLERPELLLLALLYHDVGKGLPFDNHIEGSLHAVEQVFARLGLDDEEREDVRFLISRHLDMSATLLRRDIFDSETIQTFAEKMSSPGRLALLTLLTFADIQAVNPEALTPWKAEMLWQLYAATSNHLNRSLDRDRVHAGAQTSLVDSVLAHVPGKPSRWSIESFLEGFPQRYLATHTPEKIAAHYSLSLGLGQSPVQTQLHHHRRFFELTVTTSDRPALFATIAGTLAAWGMNIVKAEAFSNSAGIVLDTFHFEDLHRTLELNPSETSRFQQSLADVISGKQLLEPLLRGRIAHARQRPPKVRVPTEVRFDDSCSSHSTLLEIIAQDRPGLLHRIGSVLAAQGCNIEVALIDTEGQKAIDVFYLTAQGAKLSSALQSAVAESLEKQL